MNILWFNICCVFFFELKIFPEPELESKPPYVVDHVVVVKPGIGYTSTDSFTDNDGNTYKPYIDNYGRIVRLSPPDPEKFSVKNVEQLPKIKIVSETGSGAILKPSLKPRPEYQGEIKEVIAYASHAKHVV